MTAAGVLLSLCYVVAAILFMLCLRGLSGPQTARRGLVLGEVGMLVAVVGTLLQRGIVTYEWILVGLFLGSTIGVAISATIPMTKMPERIALSHSFGGLGDGAGGHRGVRARGPAAVDVQDGRARPRRRSWAC